MIDVGEGVEHQLGVTQTHLDTAVAILKEEGYALHKLFRFRKQLYQVSLQL